MIDDFFNIDKFKHIWCHQIGKNFIVMGEFDQDDSEYYLSEKFVYLKYESRSKNTIKWYCRYGTNFNGY